MKSKKDIKSTSKPTQNSKVKVLYQNLGGRWYAFTAIGDQVFFGLVPVDQHITKTKKKSKTQKPQTEQEAA